MFKMFRTTGHIAVYREAHKGLIPDMFLTAAHPSELVTESSVSWLQG